MTRYITIEKCSECPFQKHTIEIGKQGYCIRHGKSILAKNTTPDWCSLPEEPTNQEKPKCRICDWGAENKIYDNYCGGCGRAFDR